MGADRPPGLIPWGGLTETPKLSWDQWRFLELGLKLYVCHSCTFWDRTRVGHEGAHPPWQKATKAEEGGRACPTLVLRNPPPSAPHNNPGNSPVLGSVA
jgi:hypothetical protein